MEGVTTEFLDLTECVCVCVHAHLYVWVDLCTEMFTLSIGRGNYAFEFMTRHSEATLRRLLDLCYAYCLMHLFVDLICF